MKIKNLKTIIVSLVTLIASAPLAQGASPFGDLTNRNDIEFTFVSKYLVNSKRHTLFRSGVNLAALVPEIESIYIIEATSKTGMEACRQAMKAYKNANKDCHVLMTSKDGSEISMVYGIPDNSKDNSENKYKSIVVYNEDEGEIDIVVVNEEAPTLK